MQLTKSRYGASSPRWTTDGKQLIFSAAVKSNELMKDSLINPGKRVPSWWMEKPG